jgi:hypothetical protein
VNQGDVEVVLRDGIARLSGSLASAPTEQASYLARMLDTLSKIYHSVATDPKAAARMTAADMEKLKTTVNQVEPARTFSYPELESMMQRLKAVLQVVMK